MVVSQNIVFLVEVSNINLHKIILEAFSKLIILDSFFSSKIVLDNSNTSLIMMDNFPCH